jgi:hypothetical protein
MLKTSMFQRLLAAFALALMAASQLWAQQAPLSLCVVQTKPYSWVQYDPPAGPWAAEVYDLLSTHRLRNGALLHITVLAAEIEQDVRPEVRRLQCPYVVQLNDHGSLYSGARSIEENADSVLFTLWNGATGREIASGAALNPGRSRFASKAMFAEACEHLTQGILKGLNKLR